MNELAAPARTEPLLRLIEEGTSSTTGTEFLHGLVRCLAQALQVRYAFIAEFAEVKSSVRIIASWGMDASDEPFSVGGTPCEAVLGGEMRCYPRAVRELFPGDESLPELGVESYLAIPLKDVAGNVLGHLAILDDKPMAEAPRDLSVFQIFAARASAEMQRKQAAEALAMSERRLSAILASAMDAIVIMDETRHITLLNRAAERVFGCAATWAIGQPFDRFLSRRFRSLLDGYLKLTLGTGQAREQMWAPEGLTALRANGEEFPIDATISPIEVGRQRLYTVILRDMNERQRAEQELKRLQWENVCLQEEIQGQQRFEEIVGEARVMKRLYEEIETVAGADVTVLIYGETGTGKELIAQAVHDAGARRGKILVKMNCAALPSELIESELFGHEKGAFTGATAQRQGRFERADGGTLFLDEVGELSLAAQAKLLRVLQEQEFERVGGNRTIKVDVRVIAATNRDLSEMVKAGTFRSDLFYRLNVFPVRVPPLRERVSDIPLLARHFSAKYARKLGRPLREISAASMERLKRYPWPGNIRELQNVIERAALLSRGEMLEVDEALGGVEAPPPVSRVPLSGTLEDMERGHILKVLQEKEWVIEGKQGAAAVLGMGPSTLRYRMQKLGLKRPRPGSDLNC